MWQLGWERGFRREWIHVYVWLSPFTFLLKLSRDLLSYTRIQSRKFKSEKKKKKHYSTTSFLFVIMYVEIFKTFCCTWNYLIGLRTINDSNCSFCIYQLVFDYMRKCFFFFIYLDFTGSSYGKESACNAGDPGLISGSGRSPGEGNGNLLQYPCLKNSMDRPWGCKESDTTEQLTLSDSAFSSFIYSFIISYRFIGFYILWILIHDYHYLFECSNCSRFQ